jgi:hypothetical protein
MFGGVEMVRQVVRERLARELASRLNTLLPDRVRVIAGPGGLLGVDEADGSPWGGISLSEVDYETIEDLAEYALWSLQDDVAHAVNGAWPPVGAARLNLPWVKPEGECLRMGFDGGIELEPILLRDLEVT